MIRQHIMQWREGACRTLALGGAQVEAQWLSRLEQQTQRFCADDFSEPLYYQFAMDGCLVIGRRMPGLQGGYSIRQLIAPPEEVAEFRRMRPLPPERLEPVLLEQEGEGTPLPGLSVAAFSDEEAVLGSFEALDSVFGQNAELLAGFISALRAYLVGRFRYVSVVLPMPRRETSLAAQRIMELMMRVMDVHDGARLTWCSLETSMLSPFPVTFVSADDVETPLMPRRMGVLVDVRTKECVNLGPKPDALEQEAARALIAHDLNWVDRVFGERVQLPLTVDQLRIQLPPFEEGMSLKQYFDDWTSALLERRGSLDADAFGIFARDEWKRLMDPLVLAAGVMESKEYIYDMYQIIQALRKREFAALLCMPAQSLIDMVALLLDSVRWDEMSLDDPSDRKLLQRMAVFARSLDEESRTQVHTGRAFCMLSELFEHSSYATLHAMNTMEELAEEEPLQFEALQNMMRSFVLAQCREKNLYWRQDETFIVMAMLAYVRFSGGVPDLRRLSALEGVIRSNCGDKAVAHFRRRLDYERKQMSTHMAHHYPNVWPIVVYALIGLALGAGVMALIYHFFL